MAKQILPVKVNLFSHSISALINFTYLTTLTSNHDPSNSTIILVYQFILPNISLCYLGEEKQKFNKPLTSSNDSKLIL